MVAALPNQFSASSVPWIMPKQHRPSLAYVVTTTVDLNRRSVMSKQNRELQGLNQCCRQQNKFAHHAVCCKRSGHCTTIRSKVWCVSKPSSCCNLAQFPDPWAENNARFYRHGLRSALSLLFVDEPDGFIQPVVAASATRFQRLFVYA